MPGRSPRHHQHPLVWETLKIIGVLLSSGQFVIVANLSVTRDISPRHDSFVFGQPAIGPRSYEYHV